MIAYTYQQRNITCDNYSLESEVDSCSLCSNKTFCRKSRKGIVVIEKATIELQRKDDWQNFVNEVATHKSTPRTYPVVNGDNKAPPISRWEKEENILKLNWDPIRIRGRVRNQKNRSTLSRESLEMINSGKVPVLKMVI